MVLRPQSAARQTGGDALRSSPAAPRAAAMPQAAAAATGIADATKTVPAGAAAGRAAARRPAGRRDPAPVGRERRQGARAHQAAHHLGKPGVQVAVLTRRPQGYFITHVEGAARPNVNGQQIGPAPHALKDHDVIELAASRWNSS
jgi:hypothetical protein